MPIARLDEDEVAEAAREASGCGRLWAAVMLQALADSDHPLVEPAHGAPSVFSHSGSATRPSVIEARNARRWLTHRSDGLSFALGVLDLDPGFWRDRVIPTLRARWAAIDQAAAEGRRIKPTDRAGLAA